MTAETQPENDSRTWKKFLRKHWRIVALFAVSAAAAAIGAAVVFLWFVGNAQSTGLVPSTLGLWTMRHLVTFIIYAILWEALIIGIPAIVAAVAGWQWWRRLPNEEKMEYQFFGTRSRTTGGGGGISLFLFIAYCIKVYLDGNWNRPFATWTLNYLVYSLLWTVIWLLIIFGIPAAIGLGWWINHEIKKKP